jgi:hypothetical protein
MTPSKEKKDAQTEMMLITDHNSKGLNNSSLKTKRTKSVAPNPGEKTSTFLTPPFINGSLATVLVMVLSTIHYYISLTS